MEREGIFLRKFHSKKMNQQAIYEYEPWRITENEFKVENNHHNETIFALGNGYIGVRGTLEEDYTGPDYTTTPGIYINGVYALEDLIYGEKAPQLPEKTQTILNLADWTSINLYLEDEKFDILTGKVEDYSRVLDMKEASVIREIVWISPEGRKVRIKITRLISFARQHLGLIKYKVTPLNFSGKVRIVSAIDGDVQNYYNLRDKKPLKIVDKGSSSGCSYMVQKVKSTGIYVGTVMKNLLSLPISDYSKEKRFFIRDIVIDHYEIKAREGKCFELEKYVSFYSSNELEDDSSDAVVKNAVEYLGKSMEKGFDGILYDQKVFMENYWDSVDIKIEGDMALQQAFRFNAFHLLQATGRGGMTNVAAKGLTGEYYQGHYFWESETYILPYFLYNKPEIARELLIYRYHILDNARINARRLRLDGALYPWRTINGDEASGFFMGSTVQFHIDADIAYAIYLYLHTTEDYDFIYNYGAEILLETARMWVSRGSYIELRDNKFCFNEVCGPDEYKPGVNNNCYTNYMAKLNLEFACEVMQHMQEEVPDKYRQLVEKVNFRAEELSAWKKAADNMYLPYNQELNVHPQDDSFLYKDPLAVDEIPEEEVPLVTNWHPLTIWRYQVIKQADVILLMLLQGDKFSPEDKKSNYDYYEPKTIHDSSLSPSIYSIIASEVGYPRDAYDYFIQTARLDLDDYHNNAYQGIHTGCMASTWMALVQGFGGMRNYGGELHFNPSLPRKWDAYEFKIHFKGCHLKARITGDGVKYKLLKGNEISFFHGENKITLKAGEEKTYKFC